MKKFATLAALLLTASFAHAQAAGATSAAKPTKELTPQQMLMGTCNKEADGLKGDERKKKMSTCLADGRKRQQEKMKACNVDATVKAAKGKERQAAMSVCLKA